MASRHSISARGLRGRRALRRFLYSQMALRNGALIALGREQPLVRFTVEDDPPSVYLVHRVADVDALARHLALPPGMALAPIRCAADDEPEYLLTLNVYRVSGITNGLRAEWSTYIADAAGVPRYLVVDARADNTSMDPVDVITKRSVVRHERRGDAVSIEIGEGTGVYRARFDIPADAPAETSHADFVTANDYIYWRNGVCDRTFYDAGLADADQVSVEPGTVQIEDHTEWAAFADAEPRHVLVFREAIEFVVSPWANVDELGR